MRQDYRNNKAAFTWYFILIWNIMGPVTGTYLAIQEGIFREESVLGWMAVLALFWAGGIFGLIYASKQCCTAVKIAEDKTVSVVWRYPFRVARKSFAAEAIQPAQVIETKDSEGDPYYVCQFLAAYVEDNRDQPTDTIHFAEGHHRGTCEQTCQEFNCAIFG